MSKVIKDKGDKGERGFKGDQGLRGDQGILVFLAIWI